jgi:hypothetical protein
VENDSVFQRKTLTCIRGRKQRKFLFLSFFCETKKQRKFDTEYSTKLKGIGLQRQRIQNFRGSSMEQARPTFLFQTFLFQTSEHNTRKEKKRRRRSGHDQPSFSKPFLLAGDSPPMEQARTATGSTRRIEGRNREGAIRRDRK